MFSRVGIIGLSSALLFAIAALPLAAVAADGAESGHHDPFTHVLFLLAGLLVLGAVGRGAASFSRQPAVLGELILGMVVGNIAYYYGYPLAYLVMHMDVLTSLASAVWSSGESIAATATTLFGSERLALGTPEHGVVRILTAEGSGAYLIMAFALWVFSQLGVILLLFMVGLENSVDDMLRVGPRALAVAVVGVVAPFGLGYLATSVLLPDSSEAVHLFIAATLCATSVGITARVFKDLGRITSPEAKVILGAAVIDDILGLIILAVVVGIVSTGSFQLGNVMAITASSIGFLVVVIVLGQRLLAPPLKLMRLLDAAHVKLLFPLCFACVLSWVAGFIGLAAIVGAFAAGLILEDALFDVDGGETLQAMVKPLESVFAPVFFVLMGMQVNLGAFANTTIMSLALWFIVAALIGKLVTAVVAGRGVDRLTVGIGMVPRGEVGLIFAGIGKSMGVVSDGVFSAVVIMVIVTTLVTPFGLKWSTARAAR